MAFRSRLLYFALPFSVIVSLVPEFFIEILHMSYSSLENRFQGSIYCYGDSRKVQSTGQIAGA